VPPAHLHTVTIVLETNLLVLLAPSDGPFLPAPHAPRDLFKMGFVAPVTLGTLHPCVTLVLQLTTTLIPVRPYSALSARLLCQTVSLAQSQLHAQTALRVTQARRVRYVLQAISTPIAAPLSPAAAVWIIVIPARRTQTALFARPDILTMSVNAMPVTPDSTKPAQALRSYALPASPTVIPAPTPQPAQHAL
jgi:hypothetical protein